MARKYNPNQLAAINYKLQHPHADYQEIADAIELSVSSLNKWRLNEMVAEFMEAPTRETQRAIQESALKAYRTMEALLESDDEDVRYKAAKDILDRSLGRATQRIDFDGDLSVSGEVVHTTDDVIRVLEERKK